MVRSRVVAAFALVAMVGAFLVGYGLGIREGARRSAIQWAARPPLVISKVPVEGDCIRVCDLPPLDSGWCYRCCGEGAGGSSGNK